MKKNLLILGAGHYGSVVYDIAQSMGVYKNIDFLDDNLSGRTVGRLSDCEKLKESYDSAIVAIGNIEIRKKWLDKLVSCGFEVPILTHSAAIISPSAEIGYGSIVEPLATVQAHVSIGIGCLVCSGAVLKHNSKVEDFCYIDCNSTVMPNTKVLAESRVNSNTVFFQRD